MVTIIYSDEFLRHNTGERHPEKAERLRAIVSLLKNVPWADRLKWRSPTPVNQTSLIPLLQQVHTAEYIQKVAQLAKQGGGDFYSDTIVSPDSYDVALLAVNAWLDGVQQVLITEEPTFVLSRPPGHHALPDTGMGFCLFANAALAAYYALEQPEINRVAILDWDVHHGNGTQAIVENHPQIAYCSLHQSPFYPFSGREDEHGAHNNVLNLRFSAGSTLADYQPRFEREVMPFLSNFQPDLLIVSAGYDANQADSLGWINLQPQDYGVFTNYCWQLTRRILFGLEGGYELSSLAKSVAATIESCLS
jgi:acetoin utilization deacetylase AcuC-like enzyme